MLRVKDKREFQMLAYRRGVPSAYKLWKETSLAQQTAYNVFKCEPVQFATAAITADYLDEDIWDIFEEIEDSEE